MSGEALRSAAKAGDHKQLLELLSGGANPCSTDSHGLTALMIAVWNAHLESVKVLCVNQNGRDRRGDRCCSMNMASTAGYTALHLAALHCSMGSECARMLLMFGADRNMMDSRGRTPLELALSEGRVAEAELLQNYDVLDEQIERKKLAVHNKYFVQPMRDPETAAGKKFKVRFSLADLMPRENEMEKIPPTPPMRIRAKFLQPVCEKAMKQLKGRELLWCLEFLAEESSHDVTRRERLTKSSQPAFVEAVVIGGQPMLSNSAK